MEKFLTLDHSATTESKGLDKRHFEQKTLEIKISLDLATTGDHRIERGQRHFVNSVRRRCVQNSGYSRYSVEIDGNCPIRSAGGNHWSYLVNPRNDNGLEIDDDGLSVYGLLNA